ncbi:MAG: TraB/GumN family protein [Erysipelotrichaceae bacterium]|nr:TraB/GumN family protein [Erysipelotrichaceae bacterium]
MSIELIKLQYKDKEITLIPTAHVSKESAELTRNTIDELKPDCICIELDEDRYNSLKNPDKYKQTNITKIIKEKKVGFMLANLILGNYQRKLAKQLGSKSGQEMMIGIEKAEELNAKLVLADRKIQTTFKRVWAMLNLKDKFTLITTIISSLFDDEEISEEDLKAMQEKDMLNSALKEVGEKFPSLSKVLVEERDRYLAYKIKNAPGKNIVAILGAAHTIGIQKYINEEYDIAQFDVIPPKKTTSKLIGWIIPLIIVVAIILSFSFSKEMGLKQIKTWILFNGTLSALGVLLAGGHILSILVAFIASPITSLNPLLAAGWFAGLTEAHFRNPTVADFDSLNEDLKSLKGLWKNKVTRILLVVVFANLGSTLGSFVSGLSIFSNLIDKM